MDFKCNDGIHHHNWLSHRLLQQCRDWSALHVIMFWPWYVSICCGVSANYIEDDNTHIWDNHSVPIFQQTFTSFLAELNIVVQMTWQILIHKCQVSWSIKLAGKNTKEYDFQSALLSLCVLSIEEMLESAALLKSQISYMGGKLRSLSDPFPGFICWSSYCRT